MGTREDSNHKADYCRRKLGEAGPEAYLIWHNFMLEIINRFRVVTADGSTIGFNIAPKKEKKEGM